MTGLLLLAASGLAREVIAVGRDTLGIVGVLDDDESLRGSLLSGIPVLGPLATAATRTESLLLCLGSGSGRLRVAQRLAVLGVGAERYATYVSPAASVPPGAVVGRGSILLAGVVVTADVGMGQHVVVMPNATLTHDDVIGDFVTIAAGASLGGGVVLEAASYVGMNASIRQSIRVGRGATIGMGAAVLTDVPAGETWVGVPARVLRSEGRAAGPAPILDARLT